MAFNWKMCSAAKNPNTIYIISRQQEWIQPLVPTRLPMNLLGKSGTG